MGNSDFPGNNLTETNEKNNKRRVIINIESDSPKTTDLKILIVAWIVILFASSFSLILWREFGMGEPLWWPYVTFFILLAFFLLSLIVKDFKCLRFFIAIILIIFLFGFGGGWQWGFIPWVRGEIKALVEPSKLLGMKEPKPWTNVGSIFAIIFTLGTLIFLLVTQTPTLEDFLGVLPLLPIAILIAAMNAFNEEFTLRAAPLSELWKKVGKQHALLLTIVYFGLGHFYGVPSGILGVLLSAFLGWFLGKSLLETKGFFWAWIIHFFPDIIIFTFYAMFP